MANPGIAPNEEQRLYQLLSSEKPLALTTDDASDERVTLPECVKSLLKQILAEFARGGDVAVLSQEPEMTAQEAADYLKIPLKYLMRVSDRGELPFRTVGDERRFKVSEVHFYEKKLGKIVPTTIKMRDMSKDMQWLSEHRKEYEGKWVAIYEDRLIASGYVAAEVFAEKDKTGLPQVMVTYVEESLPTRKGCQKG